MVRTQKQSQPSMALAQRKQMEAAQRDGSILEHMGLLDMTFVPPTSSPLLPSIFSNSRGRMKIEWYRLKNFWYAQLYSRFMGWYMKIPYDRPATPKIARELYWKMNDAFARGELEGLEGKLSSGMLRNLRGRIGNRLQGQKLQWTLHKDLSRPTCIFYCMAFTPNSGGSGPTGIIQSIIKLRTRQSLLTLAPRKFGDHRTGRTFSKDVVIDSQGEEVPEDELERWMDRIAKNTTEYVVLQKHIRHGKVGDWHIWGMTEETGLEKLARREKAMQRAIMSRKSLTG